MGKKRNRLLVQRINYVDREEHLLCSVEGCRNVIATWAVPRGNSGLVYCSACAKGSK